MKTKMTLEQWLIQKTDGEAYRSGHLTGWKHPKVDQELIHAVGGLHMLIQQAAELEADPLIGKAGKFRVDWYNLHADIRKLEYEISIVPELCRRVGMEDPRAHQRKLIDRVNAWKSKAGEQEWLRSYYEDLLGKLEQGKKNADAEDEKLFACLQAIAERTSSVWERKLSTDVFHNSKEFGRAYKSKVVNILSHYSPYYAEGMEDYELLAMHNVYSYAQTLEWKGPVRYVLDGTYEVDTAVCRYGTVLNTQSLEHAVPSSLQGVKRIMTIENKANYEQMPYEEGTVYIFCHGFFSAKEVRFLKKWCALADPDCEFLHWGDLDYGGIQIFQFNQAQVFPALKPYKMDAVHFQKALDAGFGIPLSESTRKKLERKEAGVLQELKERILETNMVVEQEALIE